jgi:hypothetical protein
MKTATPAVRTKRAPLFEVLCKRQDGTVRLFQAYHAKDVAEAVAARLRAVGCAAEVREAKAR